MVITWLTPNQTCQLSSLIYVVHEGGIERQVFLPSTSCQLAEDKLWHQSQQEHPARKGNTLSVSLWGREGVGGRRGRMGEDGEGEGGGGRKEDGGSDSLGWMGDCSTARFFSIHSYANVLTNVSFSRLLTPLMPGRPRLCSTSWKMHPSSLKWIRRWYKLERLTSLGDIGMKYTPWILWPSVSSQKAHNGWRTVYYSQECAWNMATGEQCYTEVDFECENEIVSVLLLCLLLSRRSTSWTVS